MKLINVHIYIFKTVILFVVIISIIILFRIYNFYNEFSYPDEIIVISMIEHMDDNNSFDTNWANALNMPEQFKYDQYNFSSYILSAYLYYKLFNYFTDDDSERHFEFNVKLIRSLNIILSIFSGLFLYLIAKKIGGLKVALLSLFLYGIAPIHVQDNLYARPEVFVTFLTLLTVYLSLINHNQSKLLIFLSSLFLGLLISSKITMILLIYIPLLPLLSGIFVDNNVRSLKETHKEILIVGTVIAIGVLAGLFIGMPHAFFNLDAFLNGVSYLRVQYSEGHYPHSPYKFYSLFMLERTFLYYYSTLGVLAVFCFFVGCFKIIKEKEIESIYLLVLPVASTMLPFMFYNVFFERNFSHITPLMIIIIALGFIYTLNVLINKIKKLTISKLANHMFIFSATFYLNIYTIK
jgi:4-amino-4-deoxy-L-arabinose transferase-like glycosyltransferase